LIVQAAGGRRLGRLMAVVSLPALLGPILGPVLGGLIVDHLPWRWIFYVNVPVCAAALLLAWRGLPGDRAAGPTQPLDVLGLALLSPALAALLYGLAQVGSHGGFTHAAVILPATLGVVLLAAFALHALRTATQPVIDVRLFRVRSFTASASLLFLSGLSLYGAMLLLPLYYQQVRGQNVLAAGLLLAPQGVGALLTRGWAGTLTDRVGARQVVLTGIVLAAAGTAPFALAGGHTNQLLLAAALVVRGAGLGAVTIPVMAAAYQGLRSEQIPHASSATRILQQIGGAFGAAVLAVILQDQITSHIRGVDGRAVAFDHTFWWTFALTALALIPALLLPRQAATPAPTTPATAPSAAGTR
jgi:EmrB/QacA subfamily drug resistance transporter